jgi:flavin-dependent dehydrogenase
MNSQHNRIVARAGLAFVAALFLAVQPWVDATVTESPREIPIAKEVDVVVVGGSSGAASAAIAAAEAGARVYLIAPRTYLGDDLCATLRLWLEENETPKTLLAKRMFAASDENEPPALMRNLVTRDANALSFTYEASTVSVTPHKDSEPPSKLTDGLFVRPESQSVQYNDDVIITADLGASKRVQEAVLQLFHKAGGDYNTASVEIQTSMDKTKWKNLGVFKCGSSDDGVVKVTAPVFDELRYAKFSFKRAAGGKRVLLGEIKLLAPEPVAQVADNKSAARKVPTNIMRIARPAQVKRILDEALIEAKVDFLFGSYPTELITDAEGKPCGVVMANRTGRQAVLAKVIIDASPRAIVARMAGVQFQPYPAGEHIFYRTVVGGQPVTQPGMTARKTGYTFKAMGSGKGAKPTDAEVIEYTLRIPMKDGSFAAFAEADQKARDLTYHPGMLDFSEVIFQVPPDAMKGVKAVTSAGKNVSTLDLDAFRPAGVSRVYVLGGCADVSREQAAKLLRPLALMDLGTRIGQAAAAEVKNLGGIKNPKIANGTAIRETQGTPTFPGEAREFLTGLRPTTKPTAGVPSPTRNLPVLGMYDVVVVGGGTGGAPAGIGAGKAGAKTLLLEYFHGLGGVGTLGMISKYYHGYRGGYTAEIDKGVKALGATNEVVGKSEWWRQTNRKSGTEIWFGVLGCGAFVENGVVKGVIVATPEGRGVVIAKTVIDASGNADVAAAAGAKCAYTEGDDVGVQGTGLPPLELGAGYTNTDWTFADDTDVLDFWHHYILARQKFKNAYDVGQLMDTRERRRIVGDVTISPMDIILNRTWPDSLAFSKSNFDSHGYTVHPVFVAMPPDKKSLSVLVPLRALLPQGLDGILVTGLGVSAHRDAMPVIRMQPDVQNQGYACGRAAAMVANSATTIRQVDIKELQKHLVETQCLPENVLTDKDSFPLSKERIGAAIAAVTTSKGSNEVDGVIRDRESLAVLFAQPKDSVPMLEQAHAAASGENKLAYAHILAMLGSKAGADTLVARIKESQNFDKGWNYTGMGQFGRSLSELDSYIVGLGRTRDPRTVDVVLEKVRQLDGSSEFSHHRACAIALELLADPRAAKPLAALLKKPGIAGHVTSDMDEASSKAYPGGVENRQRNESLRELTLARALYRCGDAEGLGEKILRQYTKDLRGHYARHAQAVLDEGNKRK